MRQGRARLWLVLLLVTPGCSLLGFHDEPPTECPEDPICCSTGDPQANGGCDWTCNEAAAPDLRLTELEIAPAAPASAPFRAALAAAVADGGLVWLIDTTSAQAATTFRTGSGTCAPPGVCRFDADLAPTEGDADVVRFGALELPAAGTFDTDLVVDAPSLGAPFVLRLHECTLAGEVTSAANCIGTHTAGPGGWTPGADLECEIEVADAKAVDLTALNLSLCDLLADCGPIFCCNEPVADWPNAPDGDVAGAPAWSLEARVAAIGVRMESE